MHLASTQNHKSINSFSQGLKDGLPICLGYVSVAFAFGIFAVNTGLFPWQAVAVSMANVTSAGQLAGVPIMYGGYPLVEIALSQLIINMRYALMSVSLSQKLDSTMTTFHRLIISFANTDEIFAVASGRAQLLGRRYLYGLIITPYFGWVLGTLFGAIAGNILPTIITDALGIAIYAMFIAIIVPTAKKNKNVLGVILVSVTLSCCFYFLPFLQKVSSGFVIIICAVVSATIFSIIAPLRKNQLKI
ncbi:MAG: AzlC family ABC transporter permease [Treponema sp.]|nr:AzlC family ABC transporter permease [Treponema sp.]